ncbi:MAG: FtsX-like permease family protein, partial [Lachnospiraceae bacterium]|nr:FtsX-like permease family protein [Lachnospiraceae bacterium]
MAFASDLQNILSMTVLLGVVVSAISLIIAAVSITNIMIISVQERKPEIGLMRVIGTTRRQITLMFLFESGLIGLFGSLAGVVISVILISLPLLLILHDVSYLLLPSVWIYIPLGVAVGILVCVISGLYPAIKAARLNPVEAIG